MNLTAIKTDILTRASGAHTFKSTSGSIRETVPNPALPALDIAIGAPEIENEAGFATASIPVTLVARAGSFNRATAQASIETIHAAVIDSLKGFRNSNIDAIRNVSGSIEDSPEGDSATVKASVINLVVKTTV